MHVDMIGDEIANTDRLRRVSGKILWGCMLSFPRGEVGMLH
jgi:hypothetical protein